MGTGIALEQRRLYAVAIAFIGSAGSHERVGRRSILAARPSAWKTPVGRYLATKEQKNHTESSTREKSH